MRDILAEIWRVLRAPEAGRTWFEWALLAIGHAMLGALLAEIARHVVPAAPGDAGRALVLAAAYFVAKEIPDLWRGGRIGDGVVDAGFVCLGALYGVTLWPVLVWLAVAGGVVARIARARGGGA